MKFFAYLKKLNKLGVAMTEYAVLLAFVAAIGASFTSDSGLGNSISGAVSKAVEAIGLVSGDIQASVQKKAYSLFTDETKTKVNGGNRYNSFYKEFVSGAGVFMEKHLHEAGIDTAWSNNLINYNDKSKAAFEALWASGIIPESTKSFRLLTIADDMNVSPNKGNEFSATQYLLYSSNGQVHLAATRSFSSVTVFEDGKNGIKESTDSPGESYNSQYHVGRSKITGTNTFTYDIDPTNHGFVAYKP